MSHPSPRKIVKGKRVLPTLPPESPRLKSVTFNDEIIETSIGGTHSVGKIKKDVLLHFEPPREGTKSSLNGGGNGTHQLSKASHPQGKENKEITPALNTSNVSPQSDDNSLVVKTGHGYSTSAAKISERRPPSPVKARTDGKLSVKNGSQKSKENKPSSQAISSSTGVSTVNDSVSNRNQYVCEESSSDSRRTTQEFIDTVSASPFRTPNAKQARRHTLESRLFATPDCYRDVTMGTPRRMLPAIQDESMEIQEDGEDSCSITVAVRVRPFSQRELADSNTRCAVSMHGNETTVVSDNGGVHRFAYEFSFWSHDKSCQDFSDQESVYMKLAQPLLGKAFEGYNTCLFAYGQTGSGKSYSIMGHGKDQGIIPRFCCGLFNRIHALASKKVKVNVEISFFEIYNEKIHDLLASTKEKGAKKATLKVREHPVLGPYVEGLSTFVVNSFEDVEGWIVLGNKNRATASTGMNDKSSRSHSVFTIVLTQTKTEVIEGQEHDHSVNSKINLVDLAGSERQSLANTTGERLREGANINKSLLTLGKVISLLSERSTASKKRKIFIPYRDSVLTWLLKESLGGNSKTAMMATISPSNQHIEETLSTLRYAQQARSIVNVVRVNEDPKAKIIRQLRAEIDRLRAEQGGAMNEEALAASMCEISRLKSEMEELSRSWQERLQQAETKKAEELQLLERAGIAFKVDNKLPNLVNLNEDPQLSEMLLYVIKEGQTRVGRKTDPSRHDIQLTGALIADDHCLIKNVQGVVDITPIGDAPTYVNGTLVVECTKLQHGDRVILGGDHFFRFNHPIEVKNKSDHKGSSLEIKDFDFAKQELHRVQEERLQAELEEELEKTREKLTQQRNGYETKLKGLEEELTLVEQTQKEAQSTIHSLKKQNMMLEQEVLAGRKRQQTETAFSQQALDEASQKKSRIVELLEAEKQQAAERLERLRSKRSELGTPSQLISTQDSTMASAIKSPGRRRDLYKVALQLREANKINQYLNTNLVFIREDMAMEPDNPESATQTSIRVINSHHRMSTIWTVPKFEEKLAQMRDLFQNGGDISVDDEDVFNDPEDMWEKDLSFVSSPASLTNSLKGLCKSPIVMKSHTMNTRRGLNESGREMSSSSDINTVIRACKLQISNVCDNLSALSFEESIADKVLMACHRILMNTDTVVESCNDGKKSEENMNSSIDCGGGTLMASVTQLATDVQLMASLITLWSTLYDGMQFPQLRDLILRSSDKVKAIGHQVTSLLQGCEGRLSSLVSESSEKVKETVLSLCHICGELALATDSNVIRLDQPVQDVLNSDVCHHFMSGCSHFVSKMLNGSLVSLETYEAKCASMKALENNSSELSQRIAHVISCVGAFCKKNLQVHEQLMEEEYMKDAGNLSPSVCQSMHYKRLQGVLVHSSAIVDSAALIVQSAETVTQDSVHDGKRLERCADMILKSSQRLASVSTYTYQTSISALNSKNAPNENNMVTLNEPNPPVRSDDMSTTGTSSWSSCSSTSGTFTVSSNGSNKTVETSTALDSNDKDCNDINDTDLTDVTLLSESQILYLEAAMQEVTMAVSLFLEYIRKAWTGSENSSCATPRGKRMLPVSPEKSVVTPAVNAAHLRKLNIQRTIALASKGNIENGEDR